MKKGNQDSWTLEISPKNKLFSLNLKEVWQYRDLLMLFVKRDVVTVYKQTILGPLWYLIQPLFTSVIFTLIFNGVADIQTGDVNPFLFNLAGVTIWNYFKECFTATSTTFTTNASIFGKVYFPRIIMPMSVVISNLLKFAIQLSIFFGFYLFYYVNGDPIRLNKMVLLFPVMVIFMAMLGLGLGMIISSLVTKYRDLKVLIGFGLSLLMYVSAVMYPVDYFVEKLPKYSWIVEYNPLTFVVETVRYGLLDEGSFTWGMFTYTSIICTFILGMGILIFNKTEKNFIDTV